MKKDVKEIFNAIEDALLSASYYISNDADVICDDEFLQENENVLTQINAALDMIRQLKTDSSVNLC